MRRWWFFAQGALVAALAVLAFPGASSALRPTYVIDLTSSGPSPAAVSSPAGLGHFVITNTDSVAHTLAFANGACSEQVAAGARAQCDLSFLGYAGDYAYTEDGTDQGDITIAAVGRSVSLTADSHSLRRGSLLTLHGRLQEQNAGWSPPGAGMPQPILILSSPDGHRPFHRVAVVWAKLDPTRRPGAPYGELLWHIRTRPKASTVYTAEAVYQPSGGRVWEQAFSTPFRVRLHR